MRELTCIVCPIGCSLKIEGTAESGGTESLTITGNKCSRGSVYAREEILSPKRTVTATCSINLPAGSPGMRSLAAPRRIPVKSSLPCPREKINDLLANIYSLKVNLPVKAGDKLLTDWKGSGIDIVAVRSLEP